MTFTNIVLMYLIEIIHNISSFYLIEVVDRGSETQFQVGKKLILIT